MGELLAGRRESASFQRVFRREVRRGRWRG
jgi:hypothetical protein